MSGDDLARALNTLADPGNDVSEASSMFTDVLPVSGAAISTVGDFLGTQTVSASDDLALRVDELQFDLGEGPCWDALRQRTPVLAIDLPAAQKQWPAFAPAATERGIASVFAFPLFIGPLRIGAIDLYSTTTTDLDDHDQQRASAMAAVVSRRVLHRALAATLNADEETDSDLYSRRVVYQATGMVLAQLDVTPDDARLVLQGHAFANGRTVMEVAHQVVARELRFAHTETGIEER